MPERVTYGSFWQRVGASILDWLVLITPMSIVNGIFGDRNYFVDVMYGHNDNRGLYSMLINQVIVLIYCAVMESSNTQATVGKMALKLRVTDLNGNRVSFGQALGRNVGKYLSTVILFIGYLMVAWDEKRQGLHDKLAGTLVIKK